MKLEFFFKLKSEIVGYLHVTCTREANTSLILIYLCMSVRPSATLADVFLLDFHGKTIVPYAMKLVPYMGPGCKASLPKPCRS